MLYDAFLVFPILGAPRASWELLGPCNFMLQPKRFCPLHRTTCVCGRWRFSLRWILWKKTHCPLSHVDDAWCLAVVNGFWIAVPIFFFRWCFIASALWEWLKQRHHAILLNIHNITAQYTGGNNSMKSERTQQTVTKIFCWSKHHIFCILKKKHTRELFGIKILNYRQVI